MPQTIPAAEAKTRFGELLDHAQREPVTISKKGRPVAVMMSLRQFEEVQRRKQESPRLEDAAGRADRDRPNAGPDKVDAGAGIDGESFAKALILMKTLTATGG